MRAQGAQIRGCPRNCRRIADDHKCHWGRTRSLGRWSEAMTREPGNLLPVMVTRERVGRGAPMSKSSWRTAAWGEGRMNGNRADGVCFAVERTVQIFHCRSFFAPLAAHVAGSTPWGRVQAIFANIRGSAWSPGFPRVGIDESGVAQAGVQAGKGLTAWGRSSYRRRIASRCVEPIRERNEAGRLRALRVVLVHKRPWWLQLQPTDGAQPGGFRSTQTS